MRPPHEAAPGGTPVEAGARRGCERAAEPRALPRGTVRGMDRVVIERTAEGCTFVDMREGRAVEFAKTIELRCAAGRMSVIDGELHHVVDGKRCRYTADQLCEKLPPGLERLPGPRPTTPGTVRRSR